MKTRALATAAAAAAAIAIPSLAAASTSLSGGVWASYRYVTNSDFASPAFNQYLDEETGGDIGREALILYADHTQDDGPWSLSAETRFGPGSFTDVANNSTGDNFVIHKLWVGYDFSPDWKAYIGKSQVPFGWKTVNFWPGDLLMGGYGDQMDVGGKVSGGFGNFGLSVAYYHQDDWGETSTDTVDDNRHWGSSTTYRKIQTGVVDFNYTLQHGENSSSQFGISAQAGRLEDLSNLQGDCSDASGNPASCSGMDNGSHNAVALYYQGQYGPATAKAEVIRVNRDVPNMTNDVKNTRYALEGGYAFGNWFAYLDATAATTDTDGNNADTVHAYAPGVRYDYGPGWFYVEYLKSDGDIGRNGDIYEADFDALYVTMDYYF